MLGNRITTLHDVLSPSASKRAVVVEPRAWNALERRPISLKTVKKIKHGELLSCSLVITSKERVARFAVVNAQVS